VFRKAYIWAHDLQTKVDVVTSQLEQYKVSLVLFYIPTCWLNFLPVVDRFGFMSKGFKLEYGDYMYLSIIVNYYFTGTKAFCFCWLE
jgi:hypothetical protein